MSKTAIIIIGILIVIALIIEGIYFIQEINKIPENLKFKLDEYKKNDLADSMQYALYAFTLNISDCKYFNGIGDCAKYKNLCIDNDDCWHKTKQYKKLYKGAAK